ncbi:CopG family transcriptional regulator [Candidatus Woesearchaeota archaeon]|nr:CopG family transcriptional regulator [Candidatus Woesearchaeota archaeon]
MESELEMVPSKLTKRLIRDAEELIKEGLYASKSELIRDAVRQLVNKAKATRLEAAIKEDVEWGLHGR